MGKTKVSLEQAVDNLKEAVVDGKLSFEVMMPAVESLEFPEEMRAYFESLVDITEEAVKIDVDRKRDVSAVEQVNQGTPLRYVATDLAYQHLRRLINHYNDKEVHERWNVALPELKTAGGFACII